MKTTYTRTNDKFVPNAETVKLTNKRGEEILIDIRRTTADEKDKKTAMSLWVKEKRLPKFIKNRVTVQTYATDKAGNCYGYYNPTVKLHESGKRMVINFDWMLEDTEENRQKIIDEVIRLANADEWTNECRYATK